MQLKSSLKQLLVESRANPGFTSLYIGGVAFAVAFTMIFAIIYYVHLAPLYPEYNRSTTYYISNLTVRNDKTNSMGQSSVGLPFIREFVKNSENIEYSTIVYQKQGFIQPPDQSGDIVVNIIDTNPDFFKLYSYEFVAGRPFNEAETESAINSIVVDTSVANRLFGSPEQAVGKEISITYKPYRIVGIVRDGNPVAYLSYANVFCPYTIRTKSDNASLKGDKRDYLGDYSVPIKFKDRRQAERFRAELTEKVRRANAADSTGQRLKIQSAPISHTMRILSQRTNGDDLSMTEYLKPLLITLLVLLIIPAINISGMIGGQMDRRLAEIGVRRSFGATRGHLTRQVMFENLILTLFGGLVGFIIAWLIIVFGRNMLLKLIIPTWECIDAPAEISAEMMFAPLIFIAALLLCLLLNLLSAYIPVRLSLRRPIISSLNSKR
ncbi:ABC transporter permease [uncultured Duncaniella sp.]|uniref:ABC transporter permease n=1 Tax=uncultured Duncaniella sp. TaxID=2768039 RepID=UPI0025FEE320|nr:ABC transporter permease [uncultured Duncaniella sp.]